ncbi:hypothetical protein ACOSQ4_012430 [Xanthoceras sorbifolium]
MQGCFEVEVVEAKAILEGLKLSRRRFDPLLVEFDALNVINLCVGKLISRCEVDNLLQQKREIIKKILVVVPYAHCI